jgi:hypothetical protein
LDIEKEMTLVREMAVWKPWEAPAGHVPKLFIDFKDIPSNVRNFRDFQHELGNK